jgi:glutamine---fructose-6-phosphate transaminase (isomerizing)
MFTSNNKKSNPSTLYMCGIVGYLGNTSFQEKVLCSLSLLQNRGYDSVGICSIHQNQLVSIKYASTQTNDALKRVEESVLQNHDLCESTVGIGHTRWATHGAKTQPNAHPHFDQSNTIAIVHNGIIENFQERKEELLLQNVVFRSQTDTEVIAIMIGQYLQAGHSVRDSIQQTVDRLSGTWALVLLHKDYPNKIWITRNGSPLLLGMSDDFVMVVSEQIAFGNYIQKYVVLENHDILEITSTENGNIQFDQSVQHYEIKEKCKTPIEYTPAHYKHWMLKEIAEQPDTVNRALNNGGRISLQNIVKLGGLDANKQRLAELDHLILLGCGTSYHAGLWALDIFKTLDIFQTISVYDGAEFTVKDVPRQGKTGLVLLSQSGETKDLHRCIQIAKECHFCTLCTIGVVNVVDSLIARETDCGVYLNAGREVAVASTKSFTNQCVVLTLIAVWFSQCRDPENRVQYKRTKIINDLRNLSFQIQHIMDHSHIIEGFAEHLSDTSHHSMFLLGKGQEEAIAKEGALKLKEVAYIHAEGYSSSALKHGPFALITPGLPIVLLDVNEIHRDKIQNAYQEVMAREAYVLRISDNHRDKTESRLSSILLVDKNPTFGGILANVCVQLLSYYIAVEKGYNPDFPRNLAKVVTVE